MKKLTAQKIKVTAKGFSIIEILVVVFLTGMIVVAVANLVPVVTLVGSGNRELIAKQIAAQKIEDVRTQGYDNLANGVSEIVDPRLNPLQEASATATISDCPVNICSNMELLKQLQVLITWKENGKTKNYQVTTLITKGGLK